MDDTQRPGRADRLALYGMAALVGAVVLAGIVAAASALPFASSEPARVALPVSAEQSEWLLANAPVPAPAVLNVDSVLVTVDHPTTAQIAGLWGQPLLAIVCVGVGAGLAITLLLRLARGTIFHAGSARLAYLGAIVPLVWWVGSMVFTELQVADARELLFDATHEYYAWTLDLSPVAWTFAIAAVGLALQIGERMRRDTEGLV